MATITIIDRHGIAHKIDAPTDLNMNLMELCKSSELPVEGTCGGMALCSTCHLYIESDHELSTMTASEIEMLDLAYNVKNNSRLGCQLYIDESMEGMVVRLAPAFD